MYVSLVEEKKLVAQFILFCFSLSKCSGIRLWGWRNKKQKIMRENYAGKRAARFPIGKGIPFNIDTVFFTFFVMLHVSFEFFYSNPKS